MLSAAPGVGAGLRRGSRVSLAMVIGFKAEIRPSF